MEFSAPVVQLEDRACRRIDQLRENPQVGPEKFPGLVERLAAVPDPRGPRGVGHRLAVASALTACAVLAGATSLPAVGEWIADAPGRAGTGRCRQPAAVQP
ncbi:transposase family protein [Streptomyces sp. NPDC050759]|uniref:transposase family protein n=1 Tax=Streptomyces sp. NPDC050759 TaxID=3365635 RepID=UPI00378AB7E7